MHSLICRGTADEHPTAEARSTASYLFHPRAGAPRSPGSCSRYSLSHPALRRFPSISGLHRCPHMRRRHERAPAPSGLSRSRRLGPCHRRRSHHGLQRDSLRSAFDAHARGRPHCADFFARWSARQCHQPARPIPMLNLLSPRWESSSAARNAGEAFVEPRFTPARPTPRCWTRACRLGAASGEGRRESILQAQDIAEVVRMLARFPPRAHIPELVIKPTIDDFS